MMKVEEIPLKQIIRPLPRQNDLKKVEDLMKSIDEIGQQEP
ncbi:MAG: chromosome partitioning protein ParB, partial [Cyanobacteriota bacterium]|nr:chromosome partitioning protein ParB [Cyanobacteriota bacterium]